MNRKSIKKRRKHSHPQNSPKLMLDYNADDSITISAAVKLIALLRLVNDELGFAESRSDPSRAQALRSVVSIISLAIEQLADEMIPGQYRKLLNGSLELADALDTLSGKAGGA